MKSTKKNWLLIAYYALATADIASILLGIERYYTKPLLMPLLIAMVITQTTSRPILVLLALGFSFWGDFFLMFKGKTYFLLGLGSFLIAQIHYCLHFYKVHKSNPTKWNTRLISILGVYLLGSNIFLFPYLGEMKMAVILYGLILSTMLVLANQASQSTSQNGFFYGALLFIISDSLLGLNMFYLKGNMLLSVSVMLTYIFAQLLLTKASIEHENK